MTATIRAVEEHDVDAVVGLVHELAAYERAAEHCLLCSGTSPRSPRERDTVRSSAARCGS